MKTNKLKQLTEKQELYRSFCDDENKFRAVLLRHHYLKHYDTIYCPETGFYEWNGQYWKKVSENYIGNILNNILADEVTSRRINETIELIKRETNVDIDRFNQNRHRLVLKNGTLDIADWKNPIFYSDKYYKNDYATIQLNVNYDENAQYDNFKKYLTTTFDADKERIWLIGEMLGYCLQPSCKHEKTFILYGTGANGKSKLLNVIDNIWTKDNISEVSMSDLDKPFSRSAIHNKLINKSSELEAKVMDTSYFKKIVSGENIDAQFKFKDVFTFKNMAKMVFSMNSLPVVKDRSDGFYRRIIMIPFLNKFEGDNMDVDLDDKLAAEVDGIFQFALKGLSRLAENNRFTHSAKAEELLQEYKDENDPVKEFLEDTIEIDEDDYILCKDLYLRYKENCDDFGYKAMNDRSFGKEIRRVHGDIKSRKRINGKLEYIYDGVKFKDSGFGSLRSVK